MLSRRASDFPHRHHPRQQALRGAWLIVLFAAAWIFAQPRAFTAESPANVNLLANPSFDDAAGAGADEKLLPGWTLRFRNKETEPALTADEVSLVDDPALAHSGRRCLRLRPKGRNIELLSPEREKGYDPGLYEVSMWVRGVPGTKGFFGTQCLSAFGNFWDVSDQWNRIRYVSNFKGGYVHPSNSRTQLGVLPEGKAPELYVDDLSVVRVTSGLADPFGDHMVLQRGKPVPVRGWAKDAGQTVSVAFNGQTKASAADKDGRWEVTFDPMPAGGPFVLELDGRAAACDVMVGDVWLCSGQSNMEMGVDKVHGIWGHAPEVVAQANNPLIRLWHAANQFSPQPAHKYLFQNTPWKLCTPASILTMGPWGGFSALGYFFGREIQADQKVAIGLMQAAAGASSIEAWMSAEALQKLPQGSLVRPPIAQMELDKVKAAPLPKLPEGVATAYGEVLVSLNNNGESGAYNYAGACFNGVIAPIFPFALRGVLWYQGEHNSGDKLYAEKLKAFIADWRVRARDPDLPFIVTQLCNWATQEPGQRFQVTREAQLRVSQTVPNTALAVTIDLADKPGEGGHGTDGYGPGEIHPLRKQEAGHRNALAARALAYGEKIVFSGPLCKSCKPEDGKLRLAFTSVGGGLVAKGDKLVGFSIAGADRKFVPAEAVIEGDSVVLSAQTVAAPVAARYGFAQFVNPLCNLYNKEELPASPFRTDDWPLD